MCIERKYLCWDPNSFFYKFASEGVSADLFPEAMFICASVHRVKQTGGMQMKAANSTSSSQNAWPGVNLNYWDPMILDDHSDFFLNFKIPNKFSRLQSWEIALLWSSCTVMIVHWKGKILLNCTHSLPHPWKIPVFIQSVVNNMPNFSLSSDQILNFMTKKPQRILSMNNKKGDESNILFFEVLGEKI